MNIRIYILPIVFIFLAGCTSMKKAKLYRDWTEYYDVYKKDPILDFRLPDLSGNMYQLKDFRGKVLYIKFWASWCGPCIGEIPLFEATAERFKADEEVEFIKIALDEDVEKIRQIAKEKGIKTISLIDTTLQLEKNYRIDAFPTYVIIGKEGQLLGHDVDSPVNPPELLDFLIHKSKENLESKAIIKSLIKGPLAHEDLVWLDNRIKLINEQKDN